MAQMPAPNKPFLIKVIDLLSKGRTLKRPLNETCDDYKTKKALFFVYKEIGKRILLAGSTTAQKVLGP